MVVQVLCDFVAREGRKNCSTMTSSKRRRHMPETAPTGSDRQRPVGWWAREGAPRCTVAGFEFGAGCSIACDGTPPVPCEDGVTNRRLSRSGGDGEQRGDGANQHF